MSVSDSCDTIDNSEEDDGFEETAVLRRSNGPNRGRELSSRDSIVYKYETLCHCEVECRCHVQQNLRESTAVSSFFCLTRFIV